MAFPKFEISYPWLKKIANAIIYFSKKNYKYT